MAPYIYTERNGIYIIDLQQSVGMVDDAYNAIADIVAAVSYTHLPERVSRNLFSMHWRELESLNRTLRN